MATHMVTPTPRVLILSRNLAILGFLRDHDLASPFLKGPAGHFMQGDTARVVDSTNIMFVSSVVQSTPQASAPPPSNIVPLCPKTDQSLRILHSNPDTSVRIDRLDFLLTGYSGYPAC